MKYDANKNYRYFEPIMNRAYDAYYGEDVVKSKRETYLKMLPGMKMAGDGKELYNLYLDNAVFYPATGRTLDAYSGMLFRKKPILGGGENAVKLTEPFTYDGLDIIQIAGEIARDLMLNSRCAVLVDYPTVDTAGMSMAEIESYKIKPYAIFYPQKSILDWKETARNGLIELSQVVLFEQIPEEKYQVKNAVINDGFIEGRRVLSLESGENGDYYANRLYVKTQKNGRDFEWMMVSESIPVMNGRTLSYIPITQASISGKWDLDYPMVNDLVLLNMADYRNEALYRDCLLFLGRPTPCVSGLIMEEGQEGVSIGSSTVLQFRDGGSWGILAGDSAGSGMLREEAERLKKQMAVIGARSLMADSSVQEAAETASIRRAGESGILSLVARAINRCLTVTVKIMAEWAGYEPNDFFYRLNTDYVSSKADVQTVQAVFGQYVAGEIPLSVFYYTLEKAELLPEDMTEEKFREEKEAEKTDRGIAIQPIEPVQELI